MNNAFTYHDKRLLYALGVGATCVKGIPTYTR